jgi:hypothetical protein
MISTRSQALPGNADPEALPPILMKALRRGRASEHRFYGRAWEPVFRAGGTHIMSDRLTMISQPGGFTESSICLGDYGEPAPTAIVKDLLRMLQHLKSKGLGVETAVLIPKSRADYCEKY